MLFHFDPHSLSYLSSVYYTFNRERYNGIVHRGNRYPFGFYFNKFAVNTFIRIQAGNCTKPKATIELTSNILKSSWKPPEITIQWSKCIHAILPLARRKPIEKETYRIILTFLEITKINFMMFHSFFFVIKTFWQKQRLRRNKFVFSNMFPMFRKHLTIWNVVN